MSKSRYATPLMISLTAIGGLTLGSTAQAGITDLPQGYSLTGEAQAKLQPEGGCGGRSDKKAEHKGDKEGQCGGQKSDSDTKTDHEGQCGAKAEQGDKKDNAEGKCGEGKCGEGGCGGQA